MQAFLIQIRWMPRGVEGVAKKNIYRGMNWASSPLGDTEAQAMLSNWFLATPDSLPLPYSFRQARVDVMPEGSANEKPSLIF
jgi:hypothetical protein